MLETPSILKSTRYFEDGDGTGNKAFPCHRVGDAKLLARMLRIFGDLRLRLEDLSRLMYTLSYWLHLRSNPEFVRLVGHDWWFRY